MKVAAIQMVSSSSVSQNIQTALALLKNAASQGAQLAVLPEYFCAIGIRNEEKLKYAEYDGDMVNGPIQSTMAQAAKDLGIWVVAGTIPLRSQDMPDRVRNSCLVYNNLGEQVVRYDKIHLFRFDNGTEHYDESVIHEAGTTPQTFNIPATSSIHTPFKIGLSICYDLRFPKLYRQLSKPLTQPCDIMLIPASFTYHTGQAHWEILVRARAIENQCYVIAAAQGGIHDNGNRTWGHSMVIDPWGQILSMQASGNGIVFADIDSKLIQSIRQNTLLDISQNLLLQRDIPSLLRALEHACAPVVDFERIHLILPTPLLDAAKFYSLTNKLQEVTVDITHIHHLSAQQKRLWFQTKECLFDRQSLLKDYLQIADDDAYSDFVYGCHFLLEAQNRFYGAIEFFKLRASPFSETDTSFLRTVAQIMAHVLANMAEINALRHDARSYETIAELKENLVQENLYLSEQIQSTDTFGEIIGTSPALKKVLEQVELVANSDCTVLILGETGSGKELFARAVHNRSQRRNKRMVKMNCAAVPSGLLESELFGHEKGAFTGAGTQRKGRFELANGSTLMLDEVGDIPLELQPKLLRVLQEREIERLGGSKVIPVDVRLIAATNRNLKQMVNDNTYRADLFYRLNVFPIIIPPLRERREDIPLLAHFFTKKLSQQMKRNIETIPSEALQQLCEHPWPDNVRELANVIERAVILTNGPILNLQVREVEYNDISMPQPTEPIVPAEHAIPLATRSTKPLTHTFLPDETDNERERIIKALNESNGVVAGPRGAAAKLGLKRTTLLSRMQRMGISVKDVIVSQMDG